MKHLLTLLLLLVACQSALAQVTAIVKDINSGMPIPFVTIYVEGEQTGTSADEQGKFSLPAVGSEKNLVLSSVGYETLIFPVKGLPEVITMKPVIYQMDEVIIEKKHEDRYRTLGAFTKDAIVERFGCRNLNWIAARYFPYSREYSDTPYLKNISIFTNSKVKNAAFLVKLYAANQDGQPGQLLHTDNIIGRAKKGKKMTDIDLSSLNIPFPEEGLFVGIEWLLIQDNLEDMGYYSPSVGAVYDITGCSWIYYYSEETWKNRPAKEAKEKPVLMLAAELTLSN